VALLHDEQWTICAVPMSRPCSVCWACQGSDDARCQSRPFDDDLDGVAERLNQVLPAEWYPSGARETRTEVIELRSGV